MRRRQAKQSKRVRKKNTQVLTTEITFCRRFVDPALDFRCKIIIIYRAGMLGAFVIESTNMYVCPYC